MKNERGKVVHRGLGRITTGWAFGSLLLVAVGVGLCGASARAQDAGPIVGWGSQVVVPQSVLTDLVAVAAGAIHSLGLNADGTIVAWGWNLYGQCDVPAPNSGFVAVGGFDHSLGLKADVPPTGACCHSDGPCTVTTEAGCTGVWHAEWPDCDVAQCPPPSGPDLTVLSGDFTVPSYAVEGQVYSDGIWAKVRNVGTVTAQYNFKVRFLKCAPSATPCTTWTTMDTYTVFQLGPGESTVVGAVDWVPDEVGLWHFLRGSQIFLGRSDSILALTYGDCKGGRAARHGSDHKPKEKRHEEAGHE